MITTQQSTANAYVPGNCTWYVAHRYPNIAQHLGNAKDWLASAKHAGYPILKEPQPDTVVVYGTAYSPLGHVAVVEKVNKDGTFVVSEMNYSGYGVTDTRVSTMNGVIGFVVPPGSKYKEQPSKPGDCIYSSSIFGQDICWDGAVGVLAMGSGGLIILGGVAVVALSMIDRNPATDAVRRGMMAVPGPTGAIAKAANAARPKEAKPAAATATVTPEQASAERVKVAKSRVVQRSPEAEEAVTEAKAGRGKKLAPAVREELSNG